MGSATSASDRAAPNIGGLGARTSAEHRVGSSAASRNLAIYLTGQALSNVGTFSQVIALSLLVLVLLGNVFVGLFAFNFANFFATISTLTFLQPGLFGVAESSNALTAVLAGLLLARYLRTPTGLTVGIACSTPGLTLAWVALSPTPLIFLASMPFFGFAVVSYGATAQSLVQQHAPREMIGRMMSLYSLGSTGTTPLGALIVGLVSDLASPRAAVGLGAASALLVGLVPVINWRRASAAETGEPESPLAPGM